VDRGTGRDLLVLWSRRRPDRIQQLRQPRATPGKLLALQIVLAPQVRIAVRVDHLPAIVRGSFEGEAGEGRMRCHHGVARPDRRERLDWSRGGRDRARLADHVRTGALPEILRYGVPFGVEIGILAVLVLVVDGIAASRLGGLIEYSLVRIDKLPIAIEIDR